MPFKTQPHFIRGAKYPLSVNAQQTPPVQCPFQIGDVVKFTNDYGVEFPGRVVTGFAPEVENGRFIYWDNSAWWFPANPSELTLENRGSTDVLDPTRPTSITSQ